MKILVLNSGSSSIKYKLYDMDNESVLAQGGVERIGLDKAFIKVKLPNGEKKQIMADLPTHKEGVSLVFNCLLDPEFGAIKSLDDIEAVGHRIVQGGDKFNKSVILTKQVEEGIEELCDLAPVHNAGHLKGIRAVNELMPNTPQVCVFDNAFHLMISMKTTMCVAMDFMVQAIDMSRIAYVKCSDLTSIRQRLSLATSAMEPVLLPSLTAKYSILQWDLPPSKA